MPSISQLRPFEQWPEIMTPTEVITYTGLPERDVWTMFNMKDFPLMVPGKRRGKHVGKFALRQWLNKGAKIE